MACTLSPSTLSDIYEIVQNMPDSRVPNIMDSIITRLHTTGTTSEEMLNPETINNITALVNAGMTDQGRNEEDPDYLSDIYTEGISRISTDDFAGDYDFGSSSLKGRVREVMNEENRYDQFLTTPSFPEPKKLTHMSIGGIIKLYFPKTPWLYTTMENEFKQLAAKYIGHDPEAGTLQLEQSEILENAVAQIKADIEYELENLSEEVQTLETYSARADEMLRNDPSGNLAKAYVYKVMRGALPHLMTSKNIFNNEIIYDTDNKSYIFEKDGGASKTSWEDKVEDAGLTFTGKLHLNTTPLVEYDHKNQRYVVVPDRFLNKPRLDEAIANSDAGGIPNIAEVSNRSEEIAKYIEDYHLDSNNRELQGLYIKFFAPEPVKVMTPDGREVTYHSMTSIKNDPNQPEAVRRLADEIITNLESNILNTHRTGWVNFKNGRFELQNVSSSIPGELTTTLNNTLTKARKAKQTKLVSLDDQNVLTIKHNGNKHKIQLNFSNKSGRTYPIHEPITARIISTKSPKQKQQALSDLMEFFGFNLGDRSQTFIDSYNRRYGVGKIEDLIGGIGYVYFLNNLTTTKKDLNKGIKTATNHITSNTQYSERGIKQILNEQEQNNNKGLFPISAILNEMTKRAGLVYQEVFDLEVRDKVRNSENNLLPSKSLQNYFANIKNKFRKTEMELHDPNIFHEENGSWNYEETVYVDAYYDEENPDGLPQSDWKEIHEAKSAIFNGFATPALAEESQIIMNPTVASDKSMQPRSIISKKDSKGWLVRKGKRLDRDYYRKLYDKHVAPYWQKQEEIIVRQYNKFFGDRFETTPRTLIELNEQLKKSGVTVAEVETTRLKKYIHYTGKGNDIAQVRPDIIYMIELHKPGNEAKLDRYLEYKRRLFASQMGSYNTTGMKGKGPKGTAETELNLKFPDHLNKEIVSKFGKKWANGDMFLNDEINPVLEAYWWTSNLTSHGVESVIQGNIFQFKPGKFEGILDTEGKPKFNVTTYRKVDIAINPSAIDQTKRASSGVTTKYRPILAKDGERTKKLPKSMILKHWVHYLHLVHMENKRYMMELYMHMFWNI